MKNTSSVRQDPPRPPLSVAAPVEACLPLVKAITGRIRATRGPVGSFEDLYAIGLDGLLDAAERFDPARGVAFTTFAYYRVRGAILDSLRRGSPDHRVPSPWISTSPVPAAIASMGAANDIGSSGADPGQGLERPRWAESLLGEAISLDDIDCLPDESARPIEEELDQRALVGRIRRALAALSEDDRNILHLHYYEDLTFSQIGQKLGICKPWAFRLHRRALRRLREAMGSLTSTEVAESQTRNAGDR